MFISAAEVYQHKVISVILTGMGRDGVLGTQAIYQQGGFTIAQNERSSVVFGMPKAAIEQATIQNVLSLEEIPHFIISCL
ncbi:MAG: hypothetical protein HC880_20970 [Bacteroidia bacterium]|nr:hypothetical protein [Bacteroidia bacterium]